MCCCDTRHTNDPAYKTSACCACPNVWFSFLAYCAVLGFAIYMSAVSEYMTGMCMIAEAMESGSPWFGGSGREQEDIYTLAPGNLACTKDEDCGEDLFCRGECEMAGPKDDGYNKWKEDMNDREHNPSWHQAYMKDGAVKRLCGPSYDGVPDVAHCQPKREFKVYTTDYSKCEASACMWTQGRDRTYADGECCKEDQERACKPGYVVTKIDASASSPDGFKKTCHAQMNTCCVKTADYSGPQPRLAPHRYDNITCGTLKCYSKERRDKRRMLLTSSASGKKLVDDTVFNALPNFFQDVLLSMKKRYGDSSGRKLYHDGETSGEEAIKDVAKIFRGLCDMYKGSMPMMILQLFITMFVIINSFMICCKCCKCCWMCGNFKRFKAQHKCWGISMIFMSVLQLIVFSFTFSWYNNVGALCVWMEKAMHIDQAMCRQQPGIVMWLLFTGLLAIFTLLALIFTLASGICGFKASRVDHSEDGSIKVEVAQATVVPANGVQVVQMTNYDVQTGKGVNSA